MRHSVQKFRRQPGSAHVPRRTYKWTLGHRRLYAMKVARYTTVRARTQFQRTLLYIDLCEPSFCSSSEVSCFDDVKRTLRYWHCDGVNLERMHCGVGVWVGGCRGWARLWVAVVCLRCCDWPDVWGRSIGCEWWRVVCGWFGVRVWLMRDGV